MTVYYLGRVRIRCLGFFTPITNYSLQGFDPWCNTTASVIPPGLKMLSGDNNARTQDMTTMTWGNKTFPPRLGQYSINLWEISLDPPLCIGLAYLING